MYQMAKFYKTKEFLEIQKEWSKRLEEDGFTDKERPNGDMRTESDASSYNYEGVRDFFIRLDHFMFHYDRMPRFHRRVMELYTAGATTAEITKKLRIKGPKRVRAVIELYKGLILAINKYFLNSDEITKGQNPTLVRDRRNLD